MLEKNKFENIVKMRRWCNRIKTVMGSVDIPAFFPSSDKNIVNEPSKSMKVWGRGAFTWRLGIRNIRNHLYLELGRVGFYFQLYLCRQEVAAARSGDGDRPLAQRTNPVPNRASATHLFKGALSRVHIRYPRSTMGPRSLITGPGARRRASPLNHTDTGLVMVRSL